MPLTLREALSTIEPLRQSCVVGGERGQVFVVIDAESEPAPPNLLLTKTLLPIVRSKQVCRDRLIRLRTPGSQRPLTLITAPAGYDIGVYDNNPYFIS
jgi:hypothetical protein